MAGPAPILVVDDDPGIREVLVAILHQEGFAVLSAANGREALLRLEAHDHLPALILLDCQMPVMNGPELVSALRADHRWATIPIILTSAQPRPELAALDRLDLLPKPIELDRLLAALAPYRHP